MKKISQRIWAMLLALLVITSALPLTALAATDDPSDGTVVADVVEGDTPVVDGDGKKKEETSSEEVSADNVPSNEDVHEGGTAASDKETRAVTAAVESTGIMRAPSGSIKCDFYSNPPKESGVEEISRRGQTVVGGDLSIFKGIFTIAGYVQTGWNEQRDGSGTAYELNDTVTEACTLYAQWEEDTSGPSDPTYDLRPKAPTTLIESIYIKAGTSDKKHTSDSPTKSRVQYAGGYDLSEITGDDQNGYTLTVTVPLTRGAALETNISNSFRNANTRATNGWDGSYPDGPWTYNYKETGADYVTITMYYKVGTSAYNGKWYFTPDFSGTGYSYNKTVSSGVSSQKPSYVYLDPPSAVTKYKVTYTDGVEDEEVFTDQTYIVEEGAATPVFEGTPTRNGYVFTRWNPEIADTVTEDVTYIAQWEVAGCTVTFDANGGTVGETSRSVQRGNPIGELPVPTRDGYIFTGWVGADGNPVDATTVVTEDVTFTATWKLIPESIALTINIDCSCQRHDKGSYVCMSKVTVYDEDGIELASFTAGGGWSTKTVQVPFGKTVRLVAEPNTQNVKITTLFDGYYVNEAKISENREYTTAALLDDTVITAKFVKADEHLIIFHGNGGKLSNAVAKQVESVDAYLNGSEISLAEALGSSKFVHELSDDYSTAYRLVGWNTAADGTGESYGLNDVITMPGGNLDLYAVWEPYKWIHWTFNHTEGGSLTYGLVSTGTGFVPAATDVDTFEAYVDKAGNFPVAWYCPIKAVAKDGYVFVGWYKGDECIKTEPQLVTGDRNLLKLTSLNAPSTITAVFRGVESTVTLDPNGGEVDPTSVTVYYNEAVGGLPVPTREGYTFEGWYDEEGNKITAETIYTLTEGTTYTARWTANTYVVNLDADGGKVDPEKKDVTYGEAVGKLPEPTREGYTFEGWYDEEENEVTAETVYTTAGDSTYTAKWTANTYTVKLNPKGGRVDPKKKDVIYGEAVGELPEPTRRGYIFDGWYDADGNKVTAATVYNTAGDSVYTAAWRADANHNGIPDDEETFTVTFRVVHGTWSDGTTKDIVYTLNYGEVLDSDLIPTGMKASKGYEGGKWKVKPNTKTALNQDTVYTYRFSAKATGNAKTGDESSVMFWTVFAFISAMGICSAAFYGLKRRQSR